MGVFSIGLAACGALKEGLEDSKRTTSSLSWASTPKFLFGP